MANRVRKKKNVLMRYMDDGFPDEYDWVIAVEVMGLSVDPSERFTPSTGLLPSWSTDLTAAHEMEDHIAELGLADAYAIALARLVNYDRTPAGAWRLLHATSVQRCEAALKVVRGQR